MKRTITITWKRLALVPVVGVVGALAVGWSGLVSIAASSGHFAPVEWFLHWTFENAVDTQSLAISVPEGVDLTDASLVQRAAGHFASGCAPCHGAPGELQSPVVKEMMPWPPRLEGQVGEWKDRELFWIGQHGVKYSGMPAWVSQKRPDEVWAMVAFLRALPTMDAATYGRLALGGRPMETENADPATRAADATTGEGASPQTLGLSAMGQAGDPALADCARCHGENGRGVGAAGAFPVIAGQSEAYLAETLLAYAAGRRESGIMTPAAGIHDEATLRRLAAHYAAQPASDPAAQHAVPAPVGVAIGEEHKARAPRGTIGADAPAAEPTPVGAAAVVDHAAANGPPYSVEGLMALGRRLAEEGLPTEKIAACDSCHGSAGRGKNALYPYLAGQPEWFIATNLQLWKDDERGGTAMAHVMRPIAINMTQEQIDAVALWYASRPAGG
ncbi:c-type cytochrome [Aureimonas pseudogalii]|uniref:Cytochrome c553 n=1 Tax=Aureimonas pseudogalii TaxID=1744844 RepID=A0A7W6H2W0_9HYPH|nr:c-type cytochrome [Aureimonas pseudogalii]MBB3996512.1 cytochrome c553 [Aureimonas pseudogalii]